MIKKILLLLVITSFLPCVSAILPSAKVNTSISGDNGTSFDFNVWAYYVCKNGESTKAYDTYVENFTGLNISDDRFKYKITFDEKVSINTLRVDFVELSAVYISDPIVTINQPSINGSLVNNSLYVNATINQVVNRCWISENSSGQWINKSIDVSIDGLECVGNVTGLKNDTITTLRILAYSDTFGYGEINVNVSSEVSIYTKLNPPDGKNYTDLPIDINATLTDIDHDIIESRLYVSHDDDLPFGAHYRSTYTTPQNISIDYDFPRFDNESDDVYFYLAFDNDLDAGDTNSRITDMSGNERHAIRHTSLVPEIIDGKFGNAVEFLPSLNYPYNLTDIYMNRSCLNGCTISAWVFTTETSTVDTSCILCKYTPSARHFLFGTSSVSGTANVPIFIFDPDGGNPVCTGFDQNYYMNNLNRWYRITGVFNSTAKSVSIYLNDSLIETTACSYSSFDESDWTNNIYWKIATDSEQGNDFEGGIDELIFWNRTLSHGEVLNLSVAKAGKYVYNITSTDWNTTIGGYFYINDSYSDCYLECKGQIINYDLDCRGRDLIFYSSNDIFIDSDIYNVDKIIGDGCKAVFNAGHTIS